MGEQAAHPNLTDERPCPACGYDLRALVGDRCPECGINITPQMLSVSELSWVHRARVGRPAAFIRTTRMIIRRPWMLGKEIARPLAARDGRRFGMIWSLFNMLVAGTLGIMLFHNFGLLIFSPRPSPSPPEALIDLWYPLWTALHSFGFAASFAAGALAAWWIGRSAAVPFLFLRDEGRMTERAVRAASLTPYLTAGLAVGLAGAVPIVQLLGGNSWDFFHSFSRGVPGMVLQLALWIVCVSMVLWGLYFLAIAPLLLLRRAGAPLSTMVLGTLTLLAADLICIVSAVVIAVWLPGYVWMTIQIVRG